MNKNEMFTYKMLNSYTYDGILSMSITSSGTAPLKSENALNSGLSN